MAETERNVPKPEVSRYAFAMFDILGFSAWLESVGIQKVLDSYHTLVEKAVVRANEKGSLGAVQTAEGAYFVVSGAPHYAYGSDTLLMWCPLVPELVADFVERCSDLMCEALEMGIPLRGALTLGDAVLDSETNFFLGEPIVEAANLEKGQEWIGFTFGHSAVWSPFLAQLHRTAIIEFAPPMKEKFASYASLIVLDWPRRWRDRNGSCPSSRLRAMRDSRFAAKWDNTIEFAKYSLQKHDWHLRPEEIPEDALLRLVTREEAFAKESAEAEPSHPQDG